MQKLGDKQKPDAALIGQFGVGFYSGFMVAERITVESRRAGMTQAEGVRWVSDGTGEFTVETITRAKRGTDVILHLRADAEDTPHEDKIDKYLRVWTLKDLIGKYSDHISLPIEMRKENWDAEQSKYVATDEWEQINSARVVDAQQVRASPKNNISSSTSNSAATVSRRCAGRITALKAAANTPSCSTSRPRRRWTCGTGSRKPGSSCMSSGVHHR
jgi:Molecular chaperone, HSP90 family